MRDRGRGRPSEGEKCPKTGKKRKRGRNQMPGWDFLKVVAKPRLLVHKAWAMRRT